jgi:ABC-type polysaccharide/polyol phosphate transport system ATPase subunit
MIICPTDTMKSKLNLEIHKIVELRQVSKKYPYFKMVSKDTNANFDGFWALKDIALDINQGQILGIIGRNGAGKTTLLNIIAGALSHTSGEICIKGRILGLFNLGVGFQDELTGKENIFLNGALLGATKKELDNKLSSIIEFSELGDFINMPLGSYSQGMRLRMGFSIIANLDFDILVIDEVLAVGDALFQNKCFERLMDFKRAGKTLIITTQSMDLIERLCDRVVLLDHGHLLFDGNVIEGINKYRALLGKEKFFVGPSLEQELLVEDTKKWADDISNWGRQFGTKEVIIESVELIDRFGRRTDSIKTKAPLKVKVCFRARNKIKDIHFGVAIFRNDGVYCYGPNSAFDGYNISEVKPGKGWFTLSYKSLLLTPGEYRVSVAVWDKNETIAFDHHYGYYKLAVVGPKNKTEELLNLDFKFNLFRSFLFSRKKTAPHLSLLDEKWGDILNKGAAINSIKLLDRLGKEKGVFFTNESIRIDIELSVEPLRKKANILWVGVYRVDKVYCQGFITEAKPKNNRISLFIYRFALLPGNYRLSAGIWDAEKEEFLSFSHGKYPFKMIFNKKDHGTVFLEHRWRWRLP